MFQESLLISLSYILRNLRATKMAPVSIKAEDLKFLVDFLKLLIMLYFYSLVIYLFSLVIFFFFSDFTF